MGQYRINSEVRMLLLLGESRLSPLCGFRPQLLLKGDVWYFAMTDSRPAGQIDMVGHEAEEILLGWHMSNPERAQAVAARSLIKD